MTNDATRANALALLSRRLFLQRSAVASAAIAVPAVAVASAPPSPLERLATARAEFIAAAKAAYPTVDDWRLCEPEDCYETMPFMFFIAGHSRAAMAARKARRALGEEV